MQNQLSDELMRKIIAVIEAVRQIMLLDNSTCVIIRRKKLLRVKKQDLQPKKLNSITLNDLITKH
jgi:hypothetical protein